MAMTTQALKGSSDEYNRILDMVGCYAVYKAGVALSCKKQVCMHACEHVRRNQQGRMCVICVQARMNHARRLC